MTTTPQRQARRLVQFRHDDLTFPVRDDGPHDGPVVVLLHGFPQDSHTWDDVVPVLHAAGLRTMVLDQRGYAGGNSPRGARHYGIPALADDVLAMLDAAGVEHAHVVGHDWGGAIAWYLAGTSDRIVSMTVLSTPHPAALLWSFTHSRQGLSSYYMALFQVPRLPEHLLARRLHTFYVRSGLPAEQAARYAGRFADPATLTGPMNWYRAMLRHRTRTPRSRVPTTYIWGNTDFALGSAAARRTAAFARSEYRFIEIGAGHWLPETHAALVADEILGRVRG
ncbi:MAG: alpha/beta fold hydrolase [Ornithinimicrobium sp.]